MEQLLADTAQRQRYLECWIVLAHEVLQAVQPAYTAVELEALVLTAAPALSTVTSTSNARVLLWQQHASSRSHQ